MASYMLRPETDLKVRCFNQRVRSVAPIKGFGIQIRIDFAKGMPHNKTMQTLLQNQSSDRDRRLAALMGRDRQADGAFIYAVKTTGIFCRPGCPSRRPRPENIIIFQSPQQAREAGFRACLRCKPESADSANDVAQRICHYIDDRQDDAPSLSELSAHFGLSRHHLARSFKAAIGVTPKAYADMQRIERLKGHLRDGESVTSALYSAGFGSSSRLYEHSDAFMGMTPSDYRRQGQGTKVAFTIVDTSLGKLLVAATTRGMCAVRLGDSDAALERGLRHEFSAADLHRDDAALAPVVGAIVRNVEEGTPLRGLAMDVQATAFTRAVWRALTAIPYGETRTYSEIAASIGRPTAARAVARACATNQLALVIPCHRVVPRAGGTGGYRWGAARKRKLLERERELARKV
jgi:AraC family transcriptional regulator of adaptative response/methylated-DNA-[protein]-cysteine methyltransferase